METVYNKLKFYKSTSHPMAHHNIKRKVTTFYTTISLRTVSDQSSILIHFCVIPREAGTNLEFHFSEWHGLVSISYMNVTKKHVGIVKGQNHLHIYVGYYLD